MTPQLQLPLHPTPDNDLWVCGPPQPHFLPQCHRTLPLLTTDREVWSAPVIPPTPTPPNTSTISGEQWNTRSTHYNPSLTYTPQQQITFDTFLSPIDPYKPHICPVIHLSPIASNSNTQHTISTNSINLISFKNDRYIQ